MKFLTTTQKYSQQKKSIFTNPFVLVVIAVFCCALWGSAIPIVRLGYKAFGIMPQDTGSQLMFAGTRFFLAGICVYIFYCITHPYDWKMSKLEFKHALHLSLFQTFFQYLFYYSGLAHVTGVNGSIIQGVGVFVAVLMSCVVFRMERLTAYKIIGCILGFFGIVATSGFGFVSAATGFSFQGEGFMIIAAAAGAYAVIQTRKFSQEMSPVKLCGAQFFIGGAIVTCSGKLWGGSLVFTDAHQVAILVWLVMVSSVAFALWGMLLRDNDVSRVQVYKFAIPIFGVVLSLMLLGTEGAKLGIYTVIGLALICIGILFVQLSPKANIKK